VLIAAASTLLLAGCGGGRPAPKDWPLPNLDLSSTRDLSASGIDSKNVDKLHVAWRFRIPVKPGESGALTATPVVAGDVVYVQDMESNVYALALATGRLLWRHEFGDTNPGPDGVAVSGDRVYGATDAQAFALDAKTGHLVWSRDLVTAAARYVDIAPQVADGVVYVATIGLPPNGRGQLYGLDTATGKVRWQFDTIKGAWRAPKYAGGGGAWYTPSVADDEVFWGTTNPYPYGGNKAYPNGAAFGGTALYTASLVVLDAKSGSLDWYDQVTPGDVRDYDFEAPPIIEDDTVYGAGKAGLVIAWDRITHQQLWQTAVGVHRNDTGPLPPHPVSVCPGLLGGVETPMASDGTRLYVPVVDLCMQGSAVGYEDLDKVNVPKRGKGELVALDEGTGHVDWTLRFPQGDFGCATAANGVVFTSTFEGNVYGVDADDGKVLWRTSSPAGINSCPALAGDTLLVGAGVPLGAGQKPMLTAYTVGG
jgi:outer membrane protein assembly factor BamB